VGYATDADLAAARAFATEVGCLLTAVIGGLRRRQAAIL